MFATHLNRAFHCDIMFCYRKTLHYVQRFIFTQYTDNIEAVLALQYNRRIELVNGKANESFPCYALRNMFDTTPY